MTSQKITISTFAILKIILIIIGFALLYLIRDILAYLILALIITAATTPIIDWLERKRVPRILGGFLIYIGILALITFMFYLALPPLISDLNTFSQNFPHYWQNFISRFYHPLLFLEEYSIPLTLQNVLQNLIEKLGGVAGNIFGLFSGVIGGITGIIFALVVSFYLSIQRKTLEKFLKIITPEKYTDKLIDYWKLAEKKMGKWLQGYFVLALVVGTLCYIGLKLLGVKYAFLLAIIGGLLEIIPLIGPLIAGAIAVIVVLFQSWWLAIFVAILFVVVQQLENYLVAPQIMKKAVGLNPILIIIVLFIGARLAGVLGMILAVPLTAVVVELLRRGKES